MFGKFLDYYYCNLFKDFLKFLFIIFKFDYFYLHKIIDYCIIIKLYHTYNILF